MSHDVSLRCRCGKVTGRVQRAAPQHVNRVICYCDDCQAFVHKLGRSELLDSQGGSDIIQMAPSALRFDQGLDQIVGLRLSERGLYRFYASCCHTPLGNTVGPKLPFVGVIAACFTDGARSLDDTFGPPIGKILGQYALGSPPAGSTGMNVRLLARVAWLMLGWKLRGQGSPSPFFDKDSQAPRYPVTTLSPTERAALRPLCGPSQPAKK
ncbi:MAG: hypothetical protein JNM40_26515 [Myxococcales bacterium]|nr:hypothetical protein [Myxococcales bacterium]